MLPAIFFAILFVVACLGWGKILDRGRAEPSGIDPATLGLSAFVAIGGVLNLAGWIRPPVLAALLLVGIAVGGGSLAGATARPAWRYAVSILRTRPGLALAVVAGAAIALRLATAAVSRAFSPYDDFTAYFVFPTKMAETGSIGVDPFSSRRSLSALGGTYFLDAIVLTFLDHRSLNLMDKGVGLLLLAGSILGFLRDRRCPPSLAAVPIALLALVPPLGSNVTSLLLSSALFVALVRRLAAQPSPAPPVGEALRLALLGAALSALKSTMIPFAVLLPGLWLVQALRTSPAAVLRSGLLVAGGAALFLLPWMMSMYASAGTPLYPVLGRGHYGFPPVETLSWTAIATTVSVGFLPIALVFPFRRLARRSGGSESWIRAGTAALVSAGAGTIALVAGTTGMGFLRQPFPVLFATALLTAAVCLARLEDERDAAWRRALVAVVVAVCLAALAGSAHRHRLYAQWLRALPFALSGAPLEPPGALAEARTLQHAVPPGEPILAYVSRPYLFDFRRNPVYLADYPGTFAPPPGLPLDGSPERLREYLLAQGISHVAFTLEPHPKLETDEQYPWMELAVRHQRAFEEVLVRLGRLCPKLHDAGGTLLLSLTGCLAAIDREPVRWLGTPEGPGADRPTTGHRAGAPGPRPAPWISHGKMPTLPTSTSGIDSFGI